jgi:hypothetical protein
VIKISDDLLGILVEAEEDEHRRWELLAQVVQKKTEPLFIERCPAKAGFPGVAEVQCRLSLHHDGWHDFSRAPYVVGVIGVKS